MNKDNLSAFIGYKELNIIEAMKRIDTNTRGILFVIDENEKLCGSLTDGDIRRWLITTGNLNAQIMEFMNQKPKYLCTADKGNAFKLMGEKKITAIPIVDENKKIVDIIFSEENNLIFRTEKNKDLLGVPIVIMAGGKGTRLYPFTKILPKPLIPIGDIPIIERIIDKFYDYGAEDFFVTVNYKKGMIKSYFNELIPPYTISYIEETRPLGTGGSLKLLENRFDKPIFITNCDTLINADYEEIYRYHRMSGNVLTIVSALKNIIVPYGVLHSKEKGLIVDMEEKPNLSYFVNTGMYIMNPDMIEKIPADSFYHMTDLVNALINEGLQVGMYPVSEDSFLDMGEFEEMRRMEEKLGL